MNRMYPKYSGPDFRLRLLLIFLLSPFAAFSQWFPFGTPGFSAGQVGYPVLASHGGYIAFQDMANGGKSTVMKYVNGAWTTVGNAGFSPGTAEYLSIVIDWVGSPCVAFRDGANAGKVTAMRYNGTSWVYLDAPAISDGDSHDLSLYNSNGNLYLAFRDGAHGDKLTVMKYVQTVGWSYLGGAPGVSAGTANDVSFGGSPGGPHYAAFRDGANGDKLTVMAYTGTNWITIGAPGISAGVANDICMRNASGGTPYVAYTDQAYGNKVTVVKYDGSNWVTVGIAGFTPSYGSEPSLAIDYYGVPHVAFADGANSDKASVMKFDGTTWNYVYNAGFSAGAISKPDILVEYSGRIFVSYCDIANGNKATVMQESALVVTGNWHHPSCAGYNDGGITLTIESGIGPFSYNWTPNVSTTNIAGSLSPGSYSVLVTDLANGDTASKYFTLYDPPPLAVSIIHTDVSCHGADDGTAMLIVQGGGWGPYSYTWSIGAVWPVLNNLPPGTYHGSVSSMNGCVGYASVMITEPPEILWNTSQTNVSCNGTGDGSASITVSGGVAPYSYNWSPGGNTSDSIYGLNGGQYIVTVTDSMGCTISDTFDIFESSSQMWTGSVDTAWSNPGNWECDNLPGVNTNVFIPNSAPHMPLVDIATATANRIIINTGASLSFVGTGSKLEIKGDLINLGSFNSTNGTVMLSGSTSQSIPGGVYNGIQLAGAGIKTSLTPITISGNLSLIGGYLQLGSQNLILSSLATINGGSANSFVLTNGSGRVVINDIGTGGTTTQVVFPVGATAGIYTPAAITNAGAADNFSVRVINGIYSNYSNENPQGWPINAFSVSKTWFINEAVSGGSDATVSLSWPLSEELPGFNNSLCDVSHYNTTANYWESDAVSQATGTNTLFTQTRNNVTDFSPFGLGNDSHPLGHNTVLLSGSINPSGSSVVLSWMKSTDKDVVNYIAERSSDGVIFNDVGNKKAGADNYQLADAAITELNAAALYYRLKIISNTKSYLYSNTIKLNPEKLPVLNRLVLYPNPVTGDELNINILDNVLATNMVIIITDMLGKEVIKQAYSAGSYAADAIILNTRGLAPGVYTLRLRQDGASEHVCRFTRK